MSARTVRRTEARTEANRRTTNRVSNVLRQPAVSRTEWADLDRNQRKALVGVRVCVVCGGPSDTDECDTCTNHHDQAMRRTEDQ